MTWAEFFTIRFPHVYFVYGLAFFVLGFAVTLEIGRGGPARFSRAMWLLAFFGLSHASHEWVEMFAIIGQEMYGFRPEMGFKILRLSLLIISFALLMVFGIQLLRPFKRSSWLNLLLALSLLASYGVGLLWLGQWLKGQQGAWFAAADALTRYSLAIPGAVLTSWALLAQRQSLVRWSQPAFARDLMWVAAAFLVYGIVGQAFVNESPLFPSNIINADTFQNWFGIPIQLFRAIMAIIAAVFTVRTLRAFEFNRQQALAAAHQRVQEEIARQNELRQEFLHRVVETQEEERTRIARELHDELGQMLTGLAVGLRGAHLSIDNPNLHKTQLNQLEETATQALGNMRHIVNELRPALLDDMGLSAAMRHHVNNFSNLTGIQTTLEISQADHRLPGNLETILFRITQEALTNVARHAQATQVWVRLCCNDSHITLEVKDNGIGFDSMAVFDKVECTGWGLVGIQERVSLAKGTLQIQAEAGDGTLLRVKIPFDDERNI